MKQFLLCFFCAIGLLGVAQNKTPLEPDTTFVGVSLEFPRLSQDNPTEYFQRLLVPYPDGRVLLAVLDHENQKPDPKTLDSRFRSGMTLRRYSSNGQIDISFNAGKPLLLQGDTEISGSGLWFKVIRNDDGRLLIITDRTIRRLMPNGTPDPTFISTRLMARMGEHKAARVENGNLILARMIPLGASQRVYFESYSPKGKLIRRVKGGILTYNRVLGSYFNSAVFLENGTLVAFSNIGARAAYPAFDIFNRQAQRIKSIYSPGSFSEICGELTYELQAVGDEFIYVSSQCGLGYDVSPTLFRYNSKGELLWQHTWKEIGIEYVFERQNTIQLQEILTLSGGRLLVFAEHKEQRSLYLIGKNGKLETISKTIKTPDSLSGLVLLGKYLYGFLDNKIVRYKFYF
jgi:hypothetical protein